MYPSMRSPNIAVSHKARKPIKLDAVLSKCQFVFHQVLRMSSQILDHGKYWPGKSISTFKIHSDESDTDLSEYSADLRSKRSVATSNELTTSKWVFRSFKWMTSFSRRKVQGAVNNCIWKGTARCWRTIFTTKIEVCLLRCDIFRHVKDVTDQRKTSWARGVR